MKKFACGLVFCLLLPSVWAQNTPYYVDLFDFSGLKKDASLPSTQIAPAEPVSQAALDATQEENKPEEENSPLAYFSSINVPEAYQIYNHPVLPADHRTQQADD